MSVIPYLTDDSELESIADAIRAQTGSSSAIVYPSGFITAIEGIRYNSITLLPPESGTRDFSVIVPDGQGTATFTFHVAANGDTTVTES